MTTLRPILRQAAYRTGILSLVRISVRKALTVIMFHRVIDPSDPDYAAADPVYTVSAPLFEQLLGFLQDHYAVVDIRHVMDASIGVRALPEHALLITFDDGWADNLRYAAPLLQARSMPAIIFAAAQAVLSDATAWWHEQVFAADRCGGLDDWLGRDMNHARIFGADNDGSKRHPLDVVTRLALMETGERQAILATLPSQPCHARMMLKRNELSQLADFGIDVGLHGHRHVPLTALEDVGSELEMAREAIAAATAGTAVTSALGCPHGRYNDKVIAGAHGVGIKLVFTSDTLLNRTQGGMLAPASPFGRVGMTATELQSARDRLDPARAARWLWDRECR